MGEPALPHVVSDRLGTSPDGTEIAAVAVLLAVDRRDHLEWTLVQQFLQPCSRLLAQPRFIGAAGQMRFRSIDADDPDLALAQLERVTIDNAGVAAAGTAS